MGIFLIKCLILISGNLSISQIENEVKINPVSLKSMYFFAVKIPLEAHQCFDPVVTNNLKSRIGHLK